MGPEGLSNSWDWESVDDDGRYDPSEEGYYYANRWGRTAISAYWISVAALEDVPCYSPNMG